MRVTIGTLVGKNWDVFFTLWDIRNSIISGQGLGTGFLFALPAINHHI